MNHLHSLVLAIILLVGGMSVATAQDFDKGLEAYNSGDYQIALQEWRPLAAEQGDASAQFMIGGMYYGGEGVPQDYAEAVKWYRLAAEQGDASAQFMIGAMYYYGEGVPQGYAETVKWYRLAAEQGDASAQNNLALMYYRGQGVLQSNVMAHMWMNISSASGNPKAGELRKALASKMTNADISTAQEMARECMSSNYQNCGW